VATSGLTATLLQTEADTLRRLVRRPVPGVRTPALIDHGSWRDLQVLVQEALPSAQSGRQPSVLPASALAAVATSGGLRRTALGGSAFWARVSDVGAPAWHGLDVTAMAALRDAMDVGAECTLGAWHGDFAPWNAARGTGALEVWDWERFESDVPVGLDAAHWRAQLDVGTDPAAAWRAMLRDVAAVLEAVPAGEDPVRGAQPEAPGPVAGCYLLAIWARYRRDAADTVTPALRSRVAWLCSLATMAAPMIEGAGR